MRKIIYPEIEFYIKNLCNEEPFILKELNDYTQKHIHGAHMISGHYQGRLLSMVAKLINPNIILEIGTYTGYSALCLAEGLQQNGKLISLERNSNLETLHHMFLRQNPQIEVQYGNALKIIPTLPETFDLVFIDADKENYANYFDLIIPKMKSGGVILSDNILWRGKVTETIGEHDRHAKIIHSIKSFNKKVHEDSRVEQLILPIRDGISIIRKI